MGINRCTPRSPYGVMTEALAELLLLKAASGGRDQVWVDGGDLSTRRGLHGLGGDAVDVAQVPLGRVMQEGERLAVKAEMSSYAEAGISRYRIEAVLDEHEHTAPFCQFLHGWEFSISDALRGFDEVAPATLRCEGGGPGRQRLDPALGRQRLYVNAAGQAVIAEVTRSAEGTRDDSGAFRGFA